MYIIIKIILIITKTIKIKTMNNNVIEKVKIIIKELSKSNNMIIIKIIIMKK